jgi:riboflavin kinase/FMN adenylyltransferase
MRIVEKTPGALADCGTELQLAVGEGRMADAAHILGRFFTIVGEVVHGKKLGRTLGYPTANIILGDTLAPRFGVYATRTRHPDGRVLPGVANVGQNPTTGIVSPRLEVWLFDFDEDLYGKVLETELIAFLRPEARFDSLETMIAQIRKDVDQARALLEDAGRRPSPAAGETLEIHLLS